MCALHAFSMQAPEPKRAIGQPRARPFSAVLLRRSPGIPGSLCPGKSATHALSSLGAVRYVVGRETKESD